MSTTTPAAALMALVSEYGMESFAERHPIPSVARHCAARAADKYAQIESSVSSLLSEVAALRKALEEAEREFVSLSRLDCGCVPCMGDCRKGRAAEIELEARMDDARSAAIAVRKALKAPQ